MNILLQYLNLFTGLPVQWRINFKILLLVNKTLNGLASWYISNLFTDYSPARGLRPSDCHLLAAPRIRCRSSQARFSYVGPAFWNKLLRWTVTTISTFKIKLKMLKTHIWNVVCFRSCGFYFLLYNYLLLSFILGLFILCTHVVCLSVLKEGSLFFSCFHFYLGENFSLSNLNV